MFSDPTGTIASHAPKAWRAGYRLTTCHLGISIVLWLTVLVTLWSPVRGDESENADNKHSVILFTGSGENVPFWELFAEFMQYSAEDLNIELEVFYADNDRRRMASAIRKACGRPDKPDAIVVQSFKQSGKSSLKIAEQFQVPVFLVNAGLTEEHRELLGAPRERLQYWIGQMLPDDEAAGYHLANALIDEALRLGRVDADGRVQVIGINGLVSDFASVQRAAGLRRAISERSDEAKLAQLIAADWAKDMAHKRTRILHRRYPRTSVIWTASDHMAAGVIEAMRDIGLTPGRDVVIGGVDATPEGLRMVQQGTLHATIGGHFMEGGWVAVLLYDYFNGIDLDRIPSQSASPMTLVTKSNLDEYRLAMDPSTWQRFDFRQLSRVQNPGLKEYRFGTNVLTLSDKTEDAAASSNQKVEPDDEHGSSK